MATTARPTPHIIPAADLSITKTDGQTTVSRTAGHVTIVASNAAPARDRATVSDVVSAALVAPTWTWWERRRDLHGERSGDINDSVTSGGRHCD